MRAIVVTGAGAPDVLEFADRPAPVPTPGHALVRVRAFGVNRADLLQRQGLYPAPDGAPQDIPGLEFAGTVEHADTGAFPPGAAVMGIVGGGAYAEYVSVPVEHLLPVPPGVDIVRAAAIPEAFLTAFDALDRLDTRRDHCVLIHAAGSGVGTAAIQIVLQRGARPVGTSRTPAKLGRLREMGLEHGVLSTDEDWPDQVVAHTDGGVHGVLDLIGGGGLDRSLSTLRTRGRLVLVGLTAGRTAAIDLGVVLSRRLTIEGTVLRSRADDEKAALTAAFSRHIGPHLADGTLVPVIDRVLPWTDIREAHRVMEANETFGKIVMAVGETDLSG